MSRKLMLLASAALTVTAFAALPAAASAGEFPIHCQTAGCSMSVSGGHMEFTGTETPRITCTSVTGTVAQANNATSGTAQLLFHNCKDTIFGFWCGSGGLPEGTVTTNVLTSRTVYLKPNKQTPGILFEKVNTSLGCWGVGTLTGGFIGHFEAPNCGETRTSHTVAVEINGIGHPKFTQVTSTGSVFELFANGGKNKIAIASTLSLTHANKTALTC